MALPGYPPSDRGLDSHSTLAEDYEVAQIIQAVEGHVKILQLSLEKLRADCPWGIQGEIDAALHIVTELLQPELKNAREALLDD